MSNVSLKNIASDAAILSKPLRENFNEITTALNADIETLIVNGSSGVAEVISARDYNRFLSDNITARKVIFNSGVIGSSKINVVTSFPVNAENLKKIRIYEGKAITPDGCYVEWSATTSEVISNSINNRFLVPVVNNEGVVRIEIGKDETYPILPDLLPNQRPLGIVYQGNGPGEIMFQTRFTDRNIYEIGGQQGCYINNKWYWKIMEAIGVAVDGDTINIGPGEYYEEVLLTGKSNLTLNFHTQARVHRTGLDKHCIYAPNTSKQTNIKIIGGQFSGGYDWSKESDVGDLSVGGTAELIHFANTDNVIMAYNEFQENGTNRSLFATACNNLSLIEPHKQFDRSTKQWDGSAWIDDIIFPKPSMDIYIGVSGKNIYSTKTKTITIPFLGGKVVIPQIPILVSKAVKIIVIAPGGNGGAGGIGGYYDVTTQYGGGGGGGGGSSGQTLLFYGLSNDLNNLNVYCYAGINGKDGNPYSSSNYVYGGQIIRGAKGGAGGSITPTTLTMSGYIAGGGGIGGTGKTLIGGALTWVEGPLYAAPTVGLSYSDLITHASSQSGASGYGNKFIAVGGTRTSTQASGNGGAGASSHFGYGGGGANSTSNNANGIAGSSTTAYGAGGGGGSGGSGNGKTGGAGGAGRTGIIIIEWEE